MEDLHCPFCHGWKYAFDLCCGGDFCLKYKHHQENKAIEIETKNYMVISEIYAFISADEGGEGVISMTLPMHGRLVDMPFVCADKARVDSLRTKAKEIAKMSGRKIKLIKLSMREDIEDIS